MQDLKKIVDEIIRKDCRKEAMKILSLSTKKDAQGFVKYYKQNKFNICCLHLDFLKSKLVKKGKMKRGGFFGSPFTDEK